MYARKLNNRGKVKEEQKEKDDNFALAERSSVSNSESVQCRFSKDDLIQLEDGNTSKINFESSNKRGIPDQLKSGLESLSGYDLSSVQVHYNSSKPKQLGALAYAQGTNIHLGAGQEKHLPHEGWHVVQQMRGRVKPTIQKKGIKINDDVELEKEADVMGAKALQGSNNSTSRSLTNVSLTINQQQNHEAIQRKIALKSGVPSANSLEDEEVQKAIDDPYIRQYNDEKEMLSHLVKKEPVAVGLNRSRAIWYRIPELAAGKFFVYGESHSGLKAQHLREASNIKAPIVYEANPGGLWNEAKNEKVKVGDNDVGMESDATKLLYGLQSMGLKILWGACDKGQGKAPSVSTISEPKADIGKRETEDGTYRLVVGDGVSGKRFWDDESEKLTRKRRNSGSEWSGSNEMSAALKYLWPKLIQKADKENIMFGNEKWPGVEATAAHTEWWNIDKKQGAYYQKLILERAKGEPGTQEFIDVAWPKILLPMIKAVNEMMNADLRELWTNQKNLQMSYESKYLVYGKRWDSEKFGEKRSFKLRDEFMFESIRKAKGKGYAFASLGSQHGENLQDRFEEIGVRYISPEEFYEKLSINAIDEDRISGRSAQNKLLMEMTDEIVKLGEKIKTSDSGVSKAIDEEMTAIMQLGEQKLNEQVIRMKEFLNELHKRESPGKF